MAEPLGIAKWSALDAAAGLTPEDRQADEDDRALRQLIARDRARRVYGEQLVDADERLATALEPVRLDQVPAEDLAFRIGGLLVEGGNALIWGQAKAGKTSLMINLLRSLTEPGGGKFAGRWPVTEIAQDRTVALLNFEMTGVQLAAWANDHGVNGSRVAVWNLRGMPNPMGSTAARGRLAERLGEAGAEVLVIDSYARSMLGTDENDNPAAIEWFTALDEIKSTAGITEAVAVHHAGHDGTRLRGASALNDYPDTLIGITTAEVGGERARYVEARGRGVEPEIPPTLLHYELSTRTLLLGTGSKASDLAESKLLAAQDKAGAREMLATTRLHAAIEIARGAGPDGIGSGQLWDAVETAVGTTVISNDSRRRLLMELTGMPGVSVVAGSRRARIVRVSS